MLTYRNGICLVLLLGIVPGCVLTDGTPSEIASADRLVRQHARDLATGGLPAEPPPLPVTPPLNPDPVPRLSMRPRSAEALELTSALQQPTRAPEGQWFEEILRPPGFIIRLLGFEFTKRTPFRMPPGLPGANATPLKDLILTVFGMPFLLVSDLPPLPPPLKLAPGPEGRPLTLDDLQRLGMQYSPAIKKARAAVDAAIGAVKDAGAYPNPNVGYEHDTIRTAVAGYEGFYIEQLIKTAGKLKLKQAASLMELRNAEVALRRAETDLFYAIRTNYFQVLVARENARVSQALAEFAENIYRAQLSLFPGRTAAAYEPMQLRPLVYQARMNMLSARNADLANWRQLAAALGQPGMPPTELGGKIDMAVPNFDYDRALGHILTWHTDVLTAENSIRQGQYNLALEKVNPIPDIDVRLLLQRDYTNQPFNQISPSLVAGITLPVWDQNRGKIWQTRANLAQAVANLEVTRNSLVSTLADAMNRYETSRMQVRVALQQIEDQTRAFSGLHSRWESVPASVSFGDLFVAQQTLAGYISGYLTALGAQWQAVTDVANLLQSNNIYDEGQPQPLPGAPPGGGPGAPCLPQAAPQTLDQHAPLPAPRPIDGARMPLMLPPDVPREERPR
jgi:cobalt-zinc-cadmium efflux system outer membrane protein